MVNNIIDTKEHMVMRVIRWSTATINDRNPSNYYSSYYSTFVIPFKYWLHLVVFDLLNSIAANQYDPTAAISNRGTFLPMMLLINKTNYAYEK